MKELVKTSRLAGSLEKLFRMINNDFFDNALAMPIITIQSTPKAYGHYSTFDAWSVKGEGQREINLGAGTLDRPIEYTCATLLHEMCHMYNDTVLHVKDCSRGGTYHNTKFRQTAEEHGLICNHTEKRGWSDTSSTLSDRLIEWVLNNNIQEIKMNRNEGYMPRIPGNKAANGTTEQTEKPKKSNSRKYICPQCGTSIRATKQVNIGCWDCMIEMVEV